ncbi:MAG: hypothetical protein FJ184_00145 [Gammaproteobacteria bacterium]|nr:hypothetical protein [Gammaproteobacteria bacterium]
MVYTPLSNYKYDTGFHRIQSGPNHEGYIVLSSGIRDTGADLGVTVPGPPDQSYADIYNAQITTYLNVTVANPGTGNIFYVNNQPQAVLQLRRGQTFIFNLSDPSNAGHPFRFSTTSNGTHSGGVQYTVGVTTSGTPGTPNSYIQIVVADSAPSFLYYYCDHHSNMGSSAVVATVNSTQWYKSTAFRTVPQAVSGYWVDYQNTDYLPSGSLSSYNGYRPLSVTTIANVKVVTSTGPEYGLRNEGIYTYYGGVAPADQNYNPYNTPEANSAAQGQTGGGVTHRSYEGTLLTNALGSQGTSDRSEWVYNSPVYCKTYTETIRSGTPGLMSSALRYVYRGKSTRYAYNYGSVYMQGAESVRNMVRVFSPTVNSSNQKAI